MPKKTPAQLNREIHETLLRKELLEEAIEYVYDRKGSEDLTEAEVCEAVRELLPNRGWLTSETSNKALGVRIRKLIPYWF